MTQLDNSILWSETLLVNLMANFWWSTWRLVFTLVFHCCLCHIGSQLKKHSAPAGFAIPNPAPARFEKIISGATLHTTRIQQRRRQLTGSGVWQVNELIVKWRAAGVCTRSSLWSPWQCWSSVMHRRCRWCRDGVPVTSGIWWWVLTSRWWWWQLGWTWHCCTAEQRNGTATAAEASFIVLSNNSHRIHVRDMTVAFADFILTCYPCNRFHMPCVFRINS